MGYLDEIDNFEVTQKNLQKTVDVLHNVLPRELVDLNSHFSDLNEPRSEIDKTGERIKSIYHQIELKSKLSQIPDQLVPDICKLLDELINHIPIEYLNALMEITKLRLSWDDQSPHIWYELGRVQYQRFVKRMFNDQEKIIHIFRRVIELVEQQNDHFDLGFWAYSYMANLYLYRILTGEEALVHAMKNYNQAYRFSQIHDIRVGEDFIFDDLEILQNILMNNHPLLVLIYNTSGVSLFEYLFQFVEVITQEQRFIPNFTALLSVVDERINELFNSPISNAYLVIENRLMVMTTMHDEDRKKSVKIAFIFSYLQQEEDDVEIKQDILEKVKSFKDSLIAIPETRNYLMTFNGRHDHSKVRQIEELLHDCFASRRYSPSKD